MRPFPLLAALTLTTLVGALKLSSYVPECAPPCIEQTLNTTKVCPSIDDNECLCSHVPQVAFRSKDCFVMACNYSNPEQLRTDIISGYQDWCNASGTPVDLSDSGGFGPWGPGGGGFGGPPTSSMVTMTSATSSPTSSAASNGSDTSAESSQLTTGAKAGIGVGVGVGSLAVIGGLVFLGFRLGQHKTKEGGNDASNRPVFDDGGVAKEAPGTASTAVGTTATGTAGTEDGGGEDMAYKVQSQDTAPVELASPHTELPAVVVGELPVHERPVELPGVMPPELSADAEVPRDRAARL
ncbi:hypothetical protein F4808DRAFT_57063 [Astrocystis sublimbata]|nr:hypothetical protein F4808DRAFT_57063 [Astrocystis sublimbata]